MNGNDKKIVLGGQTVADRAALDIAIALGILHGGWIPKGRKTEDSPRPYKYQLKEMPTASYPKRTEQNVLDSDGSLIISHGKLAGGSAQTQKMAKKHKRPWLHIDLNETDAFKAVGKIINWITGYGIETLNVAGPRATKDPRIYEATKNLLEPILNPASEQVMENYPKTVKEAVERLIAELPENDKKRFARMGEFELSGLHIFLRQYIRNYFGLGAEDSELMKSCRHTVKNQDLHEGDASALIINELWKKLQETHALRVVK